MSAHENKSPDPKKASSPTRSFAIVVLAAIAAAMAWQRFSAVESAVDWGGDLGAALEAASTTGKPVLISFSSAGCIYCKRMEAEVLPREEVLAEIHKFIPVKLDVFENVETSLRYAVDPLPTYVVTDQSGKILARVEGYTGADAFIRFLRYGSAAARSGGL